MDVHPGPGRRWPGSSSAAHPGGQSPDCERDCVRGRGRGACLSPSDPLTAGHSSCQPPHGIRPIEGFRSPVRGTMAMVT